MQISEQKPGVGPKPRWGGGGRGVLPAAAGCPRCAVRPVPWFKGQETETRCCLSRLQFPGKGRCRATRTEGLSQRLPRSQPNKGVCGAQYPAVEYQREGGPARPSPASCACLSRDSQKQNPELRDPYVSKLGLPHDAF